MSWASSLDQIWRSPTFPTWLMLAAAVLFGLIVLVMLLRAETSGVNGALAITTLAAIGIAAAAVIRSDGPVEQSASERAKSAPPSIAALPALACVDDLAGDAVLTACEKALFGSPDAAAAAVAYAAARISYLTSFGDLAAAERNASPELQALRRSIERDRYGLMAYVLTARERCTPSSCAAFRSLETSQQITSNMEAHVYENLIARHASSWNAPAPAATATAGAGLIPGLPASVPTGRPTNAEFPTSASTPPVSIMTPEPSARSPAARTPAASAPTAAKKQPAPKREPSAAPIQIAPAAPAGAPAASAPAASEN